MLNGVKCCDRPRVATSCNLQVYGLNALFSVCGSRQVCNPPPPPSPFFILGQEGKTCQVAPGTTLHFVCISIGTHVLHKENMHLQEMMSSCLGTGMDALYGIVVLSFNISTSLHSTNFFAQILEGNRTPDMLG